MPAFPQVYGLTMCNLRERIGPPSGYYLLFTDGSMASSGHRRPGDPPGEGRIGAMLKRAHNGRLREVDHRSVAIGPASPDEAEYRALIEGLGLANDRGVRCIHVFTDRHSVVEQMYDPKKVKQTDPKLYKQARELARSFHCFWISWVPRAMNTEADALTRLVAESEEPSRT